MFTVMYFENCIQKNISRNETKRSMTKVIAKEGYVSIRQNESFGKKHFL